MISGSEEVVVASKQFPFNDISNKVGTIHHHPATITINNHRSPSSPNRPTTSKSIRLLFDPNMNVSFQKRDEKGSCGCWRFSSSFSARFPCWWLRPWFTSTQFIQSTYIEEYPFIQFWEMLHNGDIYKALEKKIETVKEIKKSRFFF